MEVSKVNSIKREESSIVNRNKVLNYSEIFNMISSELNSRDSIITKLEGEVNRYKKENQDLIVQNEDQKCKISNFIRKNQELKGKISMISSKLKSDYEIVFNQNKELRKIIKAIENKYEDFNMKRADSPESPIVFQEIKRTHAIKFHPINK